MKFFSTILSAWLLVVPPVFGQLTTSNAVFEEYDIDGDQVIDRLEFGMSPLAVEARNEGNEEVLGETFDLLDENLDNAISREEFRADVLSGWRGTQENEVFERADANGDGALDQREYLRASGQSEIPLAEPFAGADADRNGTVDIEEWNEVLAKSIREGEEDGEEYFFLMDRNRDGIVSQSEFGRSEYADRIRRRGGRDLVAIMFHRFDLNDNGTLEGDEFDEFPIKPRTGRFKVPKGMPGKGGPGKGSKKGR